MSAQQPGKSNRSVLPPVTAAVRQRLQAVFEHAQRSAEKSDYEYAHDLLTQCLTEDPANLIFLQHFLGNLAQKFGNNKKGARFAALKSKTSRMTLNKAAGKGQWREAFAAACDALKSNPWDTGTLLDVAEAYKQIGSDECELFALRWALDAAPEGCNGESPGSGGALLDAANSIRRSHAGGAWNKPDQEMKRRPRLFPN